MKKIIFSFLLVFNSININSQTINWSDYDTDSTVIAGTEVVIYYNLQITDSSNIYHCSVKAENINFPSDWHFTICTPFTCLSNDISVANFNYPDTFNYSFFNDGFGSEMITLHVYTHTGNSIQTGELDLVLYNNDSNESYINHVTIRTNGQSLSLEQNTDNYLINNPVENEITITENFDYYELFNLNGQKIDSGIIENNTINCSTINSGIYYLKLTSNNLVNKTIKLQKL